MTVIIPAHNEEALLPAQLDALLAQEWTKQWEILVVDNRSTDGTAEVVRRYADRDPRVRRVEAAGRQGLAYTRNMGVAASEADVVAFCDADDVVAPGWVAAIGDAAIEHDFVTGALELDLLNPRWLADSRGRGDETRPPSFYGLFPSAHGNNFAVRRDLYDAVGGCDGSISLPSAEDVDLSLRMWLMGVAMVFTPGAVVHYRYRSQPAQLFRQGRAYGGCRPLVGKRLHRATGLRPSRIAGWRSWLRLLALAPKVSSSEGRAVLAWVAGNRLGHALGSARERFMLL